MSQTDRQTDKATHWKSAIFDVDDNWAKLETMPSFVKECYRQKEICPTTERPHFQVHIVCHKQVRLSQMTGWIKATKWIPVLGKQHIENSINYTQKTDTAVPGTHEILQGERYLQLHEMLLTVAQQYTLEDYAQTDQEQYETRRGWRCLSSRLVAQDLKWANKLSNPVLEKCWKLWGFTFLNKVAEFCEETCGAFIIEGPAPEEPGSEGEDCLIE